MYLTGNHFYSFIRNDYIFVSKNQELIKKYIY